MEETFTLFGGKVRLYQQAYNPPEDGLWLASAVTGGFHKDSVLDAFSGSGVVGLSALHFGAEYVTAVEKNAELLELGQKNALLNNFQNKWGAVQANIAELSSVMHDKFDVVLANPPFHALDAGFVVADDTKALAHGLPAGLLQQWLTQLWARVAASGILGLILHVREAATVQNFVKAHQLSTQWIYLESAANKTPKRVIVLIGKSVDAGAFLLPAWQPELRDSVLRQGQPVMAEYLQPYTP